MGAPWCAGVSGSFRGRSVAERRTADTFTASIVDRHGRGIVVMLHDADIARGGLGAEESVRLEALDPIVRTSTFALVPPPDGLPPR